MHNEGFNRPEKFFFVHATREQANSTCNLLVLGKCIRGKVGTSARADTEPFMQHRAHIHALGSGDWKPG